MKRSTKVSRLPLIESLELRQLLSAGQLDSSFGNGGIIEIDQGLAGASGVTIQGDGKILVNAEKDIHDGNITRVDQNSTMVRFNANGTLDTSFGNGGISGVTIGQSNGGEVTDNTTVSQLDDVGQVLQTSDGKFLLLGMRELTHDGGHQAITRYNADGTLDNTFGDHGKTILTWTPNPAPAAGTGVAWIVAGGPTQMLVQSDGKIIIGRSSGYGAGSDLQVVRLTLNGQLDQSFGDHGTVTVAGAGDSGALALQADGKILIAAMPYATTADPNARPVSTDLVRLNTDGSLDTSFGTGGQVIESLSGGTGYVHQLVLTADGKIILLGDQTVGDANGSYVIRYNANGTRDTAFGNQGKTVLRDQTNQIVVDAEGRIVTLGMEGTANNTRETLFSQRVDADGTLDAGYGTDGLATIAQNDKSFNALHMALTSDGDVMIVGSISDPESDFQNPTDSHPNLLLAKLQGGDDAQSGVQRSVSGKAPRSPKRIAMELAAAQSHRSPKRIAMELAAEAAAGHRSPKRIAMDLAALNSGKPIA